MGNFNDFDGFLGNTSLRRSIAKLLLSYLLCAQLVHGQECPTLPCTQSVAVYGLSPPPDVLPTTQAAPPGTSTTATSTKSSSTKTSTTQSSTESSSTKTSTTPSSTTPSSPTASTTLYSTAASSSTLTILTPQSTPTVAIAAQDTTQSGNCNYPCTASIPIYPISYYPPSPSSIAALTASPTTSVSATITSTAAQQGTGSGGSSVAPSVEAPYAAANATISSQSTSNITSTTSCGQCSVLAEQVQVYYWPTQSVHSDCARASSVVLQSSLTYGINATKTLSPSASAGGGLTTDVVDGFTFTYPSLYVSVIGPLSVSDSCGVIGATYTNPPPVAVQAITTASYDSWPSTCRSQGGYVGAVIDTLAISDIACPTWGVSDPFMTTCDGDVYMTATYGAPYNPVILVPTEILAIDPAWGQCTKVPSNGPFTLPCGIYDPPRALQTASALIPLSPQALQAATALAPVVTPQPADPQTTPQPDLVQPQPANTGSPQLPPPTTSPSSNGGPPTQPNNDPMDPNALGGAGNSGSSNNDPAPDPTIAPGNDNDPTKDPSQTQDPASVAPANGGSNPSPQVVPQTTVNLYGAQQSPGLGGVIYGGLGGNPPASVQQGPVQGGSAQGGNGQGVNSGFSTHVITPLAGVALTVTNPSAVVAAGATLTPGGPAVTSDGTYYSLAPSGNLIAGTVSSGGVPAEAPAVLTFAGSTYTANTASQFVVAGQTLAPGAAVTVSGTPISLASGGAIAVVGTSTQSLKAASAITPAAVLTFAGSTYTANTASQFIVAGQTLAPGAAVTVSGTPISLASGGTVAVVGTSTQSLKSASAIAPAPAALSFDGSSYTADASSDFIIDGHTLTPGGVITISGTPISYDGSGNDVVIGPSTESLATAMNTPADILTVDGQVFTANPTAFSIDGTTVSAGGPGVTISGTPVSLEPGGILVIGTSSLDLPTETGAGPLAFEGAQAKVRIPSMALLIGYLGFCIIFGGLYLI
ncbi:hypothetical protein JMJ35_007098 [Cladonia borealis]|uniref:Uncharacterized protein n=1 Tax=Cladonia borealis TaxID=184061 RepID=A0AA39QZI2_9LECA|nr:hypothetical protein JMJ35_007098 [Cladonia borealis]